MFVTVKDYVLKRSLRIHRVIQLPREETKRRLYHRTLRKTVSRRIHIGSCVT